MRSVGAHTMPGPGVRRSEGAQRARPWPEGAGRRAAVASLLVMGAVGAALPAAGEEIFLAKQYSTCTTCHYSPTGGGLLTPYGRKLSRQELSTFGRGQPEAEAAKPARFREEEFLGGLLGDALRGLDVGVFARPAHLHQSYAGRSRDRDFWMTADLQAAYRKGAWTAYGDVGREATASGVKVLGYEYWVGRDSDNGPGFRIGRFLPAYGIRDADHTAYIRRDLGFDRNSQVYGIEVSQRGEHHLLQFSGGPGRAESILHDDGRRALTFTARAQVDLGSRNVLVFSGMYHGDSRREPRAWLGGVAWGFAPTRRLVLWSELDERVGRGFHGTPAYTLYSEVSFEIVRGVWLKFSPQLRTELEDVSAGAVRYVLGVEVFPRTHWVAGLSWYRDRDRVSGLVYETLLLQLKIY